MTIFLMLSCFFIMNSSQNMDNAVNVSNKVIVLIILHVIYSLLVAKKGLSTEFNPFRTPDTFENRK